MLNLPTMDPSLAFVDLESGHLIAQHRLPPELHQLSIRHMAVGADGSLWFGTQWEGDPLASPSLVGRASLDGGLPLVETPTPQLLAMNRHVGAVAASKDGSVICASAPRGGLLAYWDAATGKMPGATEIAERAASPAGRRGLSWLPMGQGSWLRQRRAEAGDKRQARRARCLTTICGWCEPRTSVSRPANIRFDACAGRLRSLRRRADI